VRLWLLLTVYITILVFVKECIEKIEGQGARREEGGTGKAGTDKHNGVASERQPRFPQGLTPNDSAPFMSEQKL
jgi:hypothetical protein